MSKFHRVRTLHVSFESAAKVLGTRLRSVLVSPEQAPSFGTELLGLRVEHDVELTTGGFEALDAPVRAGAVGFRIAASGHPELFPVLEADLEVTPTDEGVELALVGTYRVPGGLLGTLVDRGGMHRVADRSIDRFFEGIADRLRSEAGSMDAMTGVPV